jgi:hypothetical protein
MNLRRRADRAVGYLVDGMATADVVATAIRRGDELGAYRACKQTKRAIHAALVILEDGTTKAA